MKQKLPKDPFLWPMATDNEVYVQFPPSWKWPHCERWLTRHGWPIPNKVLDMPYRWGAWRPLRNTKRPCDVYIFTIRNGRWLP
jgi:hypothetical protein